MLVGLAGFLFLLGSTSAMAEIGTGKVTAKSSDVDISIFGSLKSYPHFLENVDFNNDDTNLDFLVDENGYLDDDDVTVRNEFRLGFRGQGQNWDFMTILEADFALDKNNTDRGSRGYEIDDTGMTGEDFGVEKMEFSYDFTNHGMPVKLKTGWNTNFLDLETGAILYGDDHPHIGLEGKINDISWEAMTLFIFDDAGTTGITDADDLDWNVYTLKAVIPFDNGLNISPFFAYSDNNACGKNALVDEYIIGYDQDGNPIYEIKPKKVDPKYDPSHGDGDAEVFYMGIQLFGELGIFVPRAEFVYAYGEKNDFIEQDGSLEDGDIRAYAGYASLEANLSSLFKPYIGGFFLSGDDDAYDDDIGAYNPITNSSRYTATFGMENAMIYRAVPALGTNLYSNDTTQLGKTKGYGGVSNRASAESPGMYTLGLGCKGDYKKFSYKTQFQYFFLEDEGALEDLKEHRIDADLGYEFDLQLTYHFNEHFSLGNVISVFDPGDAIEDYWGSSFNDVAYVNTIEMKWTF